MEDPGVLVLCKNLGLAGLLALVAAACSSASTKGGGGGGGGGSGANATEEDDDGDDGEQVEVEAGAAPAQAGDLRVKAAAVRPYEAIGGRVLPDLFQPLCLTGASAYVPSVLVDGALGIRYAKPAGILGLGEQGPQSNLVEGWAVQVLNAPGTDYVPDFSQAPAPQIMERPDFDGATGPGGATANFALRGTAQFDMPVARTVEFSLQARARARLLIDGQVVVETALAAGNAAPVAATALKALAVGPHEAVIEYKHGAGAALFVAQMRFQGEAAFRTLAPTGATPFSVKVQEQVDPNAPAPAPTDPTLARAIDWPAVGGTEGVINCVSSLPVAQTDGYGESSFLDPREVVTVQEQKAANSPSALPNGIIKSLWTAPTADVTTELHSVAIGGGKIAFGMAGNQEVIFELAQFAKGGADGEPKADVLAVSRRLENGADVSDVLLYASFGEQRALLSIAFEPARARIRGALRDLPAGWDAEVVALGSTGRFALVQVGDDLHAVRVDGRISFALDLPVAADAHVVRQGNLLSVGDGKVLVTSLVSLDAGLAEAVTLAGEGEDVEDIEVPAQSLGVGAEVAALDPKFLWLDVFSQVWSLSGRKVAVHGETGRPLLFFFPNDGQLYVSDPAKVSKATLSSGGAPLLEEAGAATILLRRDAVVDAASNLLDLDVAFANGDSVTAQLAKHVVTGIGVAPVKTDKPTDDGGIVVDPTDPNRPDVRYGRDIAPLMERSCLGGGCHSGANPGAGLLLTTKQEVQSKFAGVYGSSGPAGSMPIGRARLTAAELKLLDDWRKAMYPD
jgi:hypothetical protein